jgi:sugar lactone lactonase YvrE
VFNGLGTITSAVTNIIVQCPDLLGGSLQGFDIGVTGLVTTVVGYGSGADGIGQEARISPNQMVSDGVNLYIADNNYTIRKVVLATGEVTTIAGKHQDYRTVDGIGTDARFTRPFAITLVDGNLYIAQDSDEIRKMNLATGMVTTMTLSSSDGSSLAYPMGLASDGIHLFVSNQNQTNILKIVIGTGDMSAIAGPLTQTCALTDGIGPAARFCSTGGMALNGGQLYIADQGNNAIRILNISTGEVTTLAGQLDRSAGSTDGTGTSASFNNPSGVAADGSYLYVTDSLNYTVRKITLAGAQVTTIAGTVGNRRAANGTGLSARFGSLSLGILIMNENLYVSDSGAIRKIETATANVTTFAGVLEGQDGLGKTVDIKPWTITSDGRYVYSSAGSEIRKLDTLTGEVITLAGNVFNWGYVDGAGADAQFDGMSMTTDGSYIYVSDWNNCNIRKVDSVTGFTSTLAGRDSNDCTHADGIGNAAGFETLSDRGLTINGNMLYVPDTNLGNPTLRQINTQNGEVTTITLAGEPITPMKLTTDGVYFYFSENSGSAIYRGTLNAGTMTISLLAGDPNTRDRVDSSFLDARFNEVGAMTTDGTSLYFADIDGGILPRIIRKMNLTTGMVTTIAGGGVFDGFSPVYGFADGFGSEARFSSYIADITTDGLHLYVADNENGIRRIE